jgi:hypothetical protein
VRTRRGRSGWRSPSCRAFKLLSLTPEHHATVGRKLERLRGHKLTYVDASSLVFLGALGIDEVWGTYRDLALEGARVVPVSR